MLSAFSHYPTSAWGASVAANSTAVGSESWGGASRWGEHNNYPQASFGVFASGSSTGNGGQWGAPAPAWEDRPAANYSNHGLSLWQVSQPPVDMIQFTRYPDTYDIHAMWNSNYSGEYAYKAIEWWRPTTSDKFLETFDRNFERCYWDIRLRSENPCERSPYIEDIEKVSKHRLETWKAFVSRLDYYDQLFTPQHGVTPSTDNSPGCFSSEEERDRKRYLYKMLRVHYRKKASASYASALDMDGDYKMKL